MDRFGISAAALAVAGFASAHLALAADGPAHPTVVITATKLPRDIAMTPSMISLVTGEDLRARGARDLRTALALVGGVDMAPGGDAGPAGSVPGMWGLREFDAFLLVVDGIPYGGAFNPALTTLDLTNVARIEVLRGAAPVMYGATSFVGVIHVIHTAPGESPARASAAAGLHRTGFADFATNLPELNNYRHSLTLNGETREFSQDDSSVCRLHALYRAVTDTSAGALHGDLDITSLRQEPYSPHPRESNILTTRFPLDANVNPADARQDQDRAQLNAGFERGTTFGSVATTLSLTHTRTRNTRGFLREDFAVDGVTPNADGFRQNITATDAYFDTYVAWHPTEPLNWITGIDWLYGNGKQTSDNFEYAALPDGSNRSDSHTLPIDESTELDVERNFAGLYSQLEWSPTGRWHLTAGLRLNRTVETRHGELRTSGQPAPGDRSSDRLEKTRLAGIAGASVKLWSRSNDYLIAFADYRDTYKPAAVDFGPEAEGSILQPETGQSWELGLRARSLDSTLTFETSYFEMDFANLVVRENIEGLPGLANAGTERFTGAEFEATWHVTDTLRLLASYAYHDAKFADYRRLRPDGSLQQLAGKRLELSPRHLGAIGLVLDRKQGPIASIVWSYSGGRFLNKANTSLAKSFATLDAGIGYRIRNLQLRLDGYNLTDRRDPVAESELGDAQFYRLPGRAVLLAASVDL